MAMSGQGDYVGLGGALGLQYQSPYAVSPPQQYQAPTQTVTGGSGGGGGMDMISSFIQSGVQTGLIFAQGATTMKQMKLMEKARKEDLARYLREYSDVMAQQQRDNVYRNRTFDEQMLFSRQQAAWNKQMEKNQFRFSKQQYRDKMKMYQEDLKRQQTDKLASNLLGIINNNEAMKQTILGRVG